MQVPESLYPTARAAFPHVMPAVNEAMQKRELRHECYELKLLELYRWCMWNRPKVVVELGSGLSTMVFRECAQAYDGTVYSIDVHEWLPKGAATDEPTWRAIPSEICKDEKHIWYEYSESLSFDCDLLYVDGPANTIDGKRLYSADVRYWMGRAKNILWDMRHDSLHVFTEAGGLKQYDVAYSPELARHNKLPWWWFFGCLHHSWARLK